MQILFGGPVVKEKQKPKPPLRVKTDLPMTPAPSAEEKKEIRYDQEFEKAFAEWEKEQKENPGDTQPESATRTNDKSPKLDKIV